MGTGSVSGASQADEDDEVASFMTLKSPAPSRGPPSRASRRSVSRQSRQSVHSVPGDPLVELMSRMVEHSQQENSRREQEAKEEMLRREQEAREETKRREQAFELREKELRRQNEQREYDLRHQTQVEMENRYLCEKLAAAEREKEKELIVLREKQEMEKLVLCEKQEAEKLISEKLLELERQRTEMEKQKIASLGAHQVPGDSRVAAEPGSSIGSHDQTEETAGKIIFQGKIIPDAEMQSVSANKLFLQSENKINSEISSELLFDALMTDVDVHTLTADDVDAVCSRSIYTGPQLTDRLGPKPARLCVHLLLLLLQLSLDSSHHWWSVTLSLYCHLPSTVHLHLH